jgi:hypothetical protein
VAVEFVFSNKKEERAFQAFLAAIPAQPPINAQSEGRLKKSAGQALVEFALMIPRHDRAARGTKGQ